MSNLGIITVLLMIVPFALFLFLRPKKAAPVDDGCYESLLIATRELERVIGERNALTLKIMRVERLLEDPNYNDWGPEFEWISPDALREALGD